MAIAQFRYSHPRLIIGCTEKGQIVFGANPSKFYVSLQKWEAQCWEVDESLEIGQEKLREPQYRDACLVQFGEGECR